MKRGKLKSLSRGGFTILETMMFLAVTSLVFIAAMQYVSGRQNREFFISSVRDFETKLLDVANDVSTGFYQSGGSLRCSATGPSGSPAFSAGGDDTLGTNTDCIFVGTVLKLGDGGDKQKYTQYSMGGLRKSGGSYVTNLAMSKPRVINVPGLPSSRAVGSGITIECVKVGGSTCTDNNAAIGFFTTFDGSSMIAENGGAVQANVMTFSGVSLGSDATSVVNQLNDDSSYTSPVYNPGITICLKSGGTNQYALVSLGGNSSSNLSTKTEIKSGGTLCA